MSTTQEYYTSGFLSIQSAIDGYVLHLGASREASLGPLAATSPDDSSAVQPPQRQYWTLWGAAFPTAAYDHNQFYDAGLRVFTALLEPQVPHNHELHDCDQASE